MFDPQKHHRQSVRLKDYDYSLEGAYFITICSYEKKCLFGKVEQGEMRLSDFGRMVESEWLKSAEIRKEIILDEYVVMPNHFHAIVFIRRGVGQIAPNDSVGHKKGFQPKAPTPKAPTPKAPTPKAPTSLGLKPKSVSSLISGFKTGVTSQLRKLGFQGDLWQRNYYEHIIRNEDDFNAIKEYIMNNPANWVKDTVNPDYV